MDTLAPTRDANTELLSDDEQLPPRRPRRKLLNRRSAALAAIATCAIGFYAGVRVEKGQLASSSGALTFGAGARAGTAGTAGRTAGLGRTGGSAGTSGSAGTAGVAGAAGSAAGAAGRAGGGLFGGAAGGAGSFGTVQSVNGNTIVLSEATGNTVQVQLSSATKVSKTQSVGRSAVRPGDTVIVEGITNSKGTLVAARVTDSGNSSAGTTGGSGTSATSGTGGSGSSSAVGSLFSSGGGG